MSLTEPAAHHGLDQPELVVQVGLELGVPGHPGRDAAVLLATGTAAAALAAWRMSRSTPRSSLL